MTDLGEAKFILGIEVIRDRSQRTIALSQSAYARDVLRTYRMNECKPSPTPVQPGVKLVSPDNGFEAALSDVRRYQATVGALMWAAICTRPDMSYAVGQLSRYASNPDKSHEAALVQCLRYLRGTVDYRLTYTGKGRVEDVPTLIDYSDADWAGDFDTRRILIKRQPLTAVVKDEPADTTGSRGVLCHACDDDTTRISVIHDEA